MTPASVFSLITLAFGLAACGEAPLRFTGIPDGDKAKLAKQYAVVADYLSEELGRPVEYLHVPSYGAAVTALASNKVDLVWLGGVTSVEAERVTDVTFVATRAADLRFKSFFIARKELVDSGAIREVTDLKDLRAAMGKRTFTFGNESSTSGHYMPRYFMEQAGIQVPADLKETPRFSGDHDRTFRQVADGAVDIGALNYKTWLAKPPEEQALAPVIYTTPEYVDYCLVAHNRVGSETIDALKNAFLRLDANESATDERAKRVLDAFQAERFVPADPKQWDQIRRVLKSVQK